MTTFSWWETPATVVNLQCLVADQLGTLRMIFDKSGALAAVKRHEYLPFGEELLAGQGGRTPALGYSGDNIRQKFTLKERDNETGLITFMLAITRQHRQDSSLLTCDEIIKSLGSLGLKPQD